MVPLEQRLGERAESAHPGFGDRDDPIVADVRVAAEPCQLPATCAGQLTLRDGLYQRARLDPDGAHVECEPVRERATPGDAAVSADTVGIPCFQQRHRHDALPPLRPAFRVSQLSPYGTDRGAQLPLRHQVILERRRRHARLLYSQWATARRSSP